MNKLLTGLVASTFLMTGAALANEASYAAKHPVDATAAKVNDAHANADRRDNVDARKDNADANYHAAKDRADAQYKEAKARCKEMKGSQESACKKEAKADHEKAVADAKAARDKAKAEAERVAARH